MLSTIALAQRKYLVLKLIGTYKINNLIILKQHFSESEKTQTT